MASAFVTGREQRSAMQMKAALACVAFSFSCAGCAADRSAELLARSTIRSTYGSFSAACAKRSVSRSRRDNLGSTQTQIERIEQRHVAKQIAFDRGKNCFNELVGFLSPRVVSSQNRESHQVLRGNGIGIGRRVIAGRVRTQQQIGSIIRGKIVTGGVGVGVMRVERALPGESLIEIAAFAGCFIERQRGADHGGEI
jgi:hypothetical protein